MAAFAVLVSHSFLFAGLPEPKPIVGQTFGSLAVATFFAMSGFLVCQSWSRDRSVPRFALRRLLRILPGLVVVTLFTALVLGPVFSSLPAAQYFSTRETWSYIPITSLALNVPELPGLFTQNIFPISNNGSLWTLRYEILMYALLCFTGAIFPPARFRLACSIMLCALAGIWVALNLRHLSPYLLPFVWRLGTEFYLDRICNLGVYFYAGCCLYLFRDRVRLSLRWSALLVIVCFLTSNAMVVTMLLWIAVPYAAISVAYRGPKPLKWVNGFDWSYGVYIYAFPIQQAFSLLFGRSDLSWIMGLGASTVVTLMLAGLSWHFVESPALTLKTRIVKTRKTTDAQRLEKT